MMLTTVVLSVVLCSCAQAPPALPADAPPALRGRYEAAEAQLKSGDHTPTGWAELLDALYRLDLPDRALGAARVALDKYPDRPKIRMRGARALYRSGRLDEAARLFDTTTNLTRDPIASVVRSRLLHAEGRMQDALSCATAGLEATPQDPELQYQIALLSGQMNDHAAAALAYTAAARQAQRLEGYPGQLIIQRCTGRPDLHRRLVERTANELLSGRTIPFSMPQAMPLPTIDVRLGDGPPVKMLFDPSGSRLLSLDQAVAARSGIGGISAAALADITGEQTASQWALAEKITAGDCVMSNVLTQVYDLGAEGLPDIAGIFGSGLLATARVIIDFETSTITLADSRPAAPSADPLHAALAVRFIAGDQAIVPLAVDDQRINAILAFGSPVTCFSEELLTRHFGAARLADSDIGGRQAKVSPGLSFRIAQRTIVQPGSIGLPFITDETSHLMGVRVDAVLGWDVFRSMRRLSLDVGSSTIEIDWKK